MGSIDFKKTRPIVPRVGGDTGFRSTGPSTSKYDVGGQMSDFQNRNAYRAKTQSISDEMANTAVQIASTVIGQGLSAFGSLTDPLYKMLTDHDVAPDQGLSGVGQDIVEWGANEYPVYFDPAKGTWTNHEYLLSRLPSVASTLSMLIPGMGAARLAGGVGRALRLGSNIEKVMTVGGGATAMRHAEGWMEAGQLYSQTMDQYMQGLNLTGANEEEKELSIEAAKQVAGTAAMKDYKMNWANIVFDLFQMAMILKPVSGMFTKVFGQGKLGSTLDYGYDVAKKDMLIGNVNKVQEALLKGVTFVKPFAAQITEGVEETVNQIAQYEGARAADIQAGTLKDDGTSLGDRIRDDYLKRWETKDAFAWGILGGVAFQLGGSALASIGNKNGWWNNVTEQAGKIAAIKHRETVLSNYAEVIKDSTKTKYEKDAARHTLVYDLVQSNRQSDTLDMTIQSLKNPKYIEEIAKRMGESADEFRKQLPQMIEDMEWIDNNISEYEGGSWNAVMGQQTATRTNTAIDDYERRDEMFKNVDRRIGNFADPKLSLQLGYNDYQVRVLDRINRDVVKDINTTTAELYAAEQTPISPSAQAFINLDTDITGLNIARLNLEREIASFEKMNATPESLADHKRVLAETDEVIKQKTEMQDQMLKAVETNLKDEAITGETPIAKINSLRTDLTMGKVARKKAVYFNNQIQKNLSMGINARILKDPKAYEVDTIENMRRTDAYMQGLIDEKNIVALDKKKAQDAAAAFLTTDDYKAAVAEHTAQLDEALVGKSPDEVIQYLEDELAMVQKELAAGEKAGTLDTSSTKAMLNFDAELYVKLKSREAAILAKLPKKAAATDGEAPTGKELVREGTLNDYKGLPAGTPPSNYLRFREDNYHFDVMMTTNNGRLGIMDLENDLATAKEAFNKIDEALSKMKDAGSETEQEAIWQSLRKSGIFEALEPIVSDSMLEYYQSNDKIANRITDLTATHTALKNNYIPTGEMYLAALPQPIAGNPILDDNYPFNKDGSEGSKAETTGIFIEYFMAITAKYPTFEDMTKDISSVMEQLDAKQAELKDEADEFLKKTKAPPPVVGESVLPVDKEEQLEFRMNQNDDQRGPMVESRRGASKGMVHNSARTMSPGSNESYTRELGPIQPTSMDTRVPFQVKRDSRTGKFIENVKYAFWKAHALINGKPGKGYVKAGDVVQLKYIIHPKFGPEIQIFKDGEHVGNMDTSMRMMQSLASVNDMLAKTPDTEANAVYRSELLQYKSRYEELIPIYGAIEKEMAAATGPREIQVKTTVLEQVEDNSSGGIYFGDMFMTEVVNDKGVKMTSPINIIDAFSNKVNLPDNAIMTIFNEGNFLIEHMGKTKDVRHKFPTIHVPKSQRDKYSRTEGTSYNGAAFALIPTHTLNKLGEHIYIPVMMHTRNLGDNRNLDTQDRDSDGNFIGNSLGEVIFETIMNPDKDRAAFEKLVKASPESAPFYQTGKSIKQQSEKFYRMFYNTENLLQLFNKVLFVYDGFRENKNPDRTVNYAKHLGMNVYRKQKKDAAGNFIEEDEDKYDPTLVVDLSNDGKVKQLYFIKLLNDKEEFEPDLSNVMIGKTKLLTEEQRKKMNPWEIAGKTKVEVNVMQQIKARLRQTKFRIDKKQFGSTTAAGKVRGFAFKGGQFTYDEYPSYIDYLSQNQFVESTVHGIESRTDPDNPDTGSMNFFYNRSIWFENTLIDPAKGSSTPLTTTKKKAAAKSPSEKAKETFSAFVDRIVSGEKMTSKKDKKYYADNKAAIDEEVKRRAEENEKTVIRLDVPEPIQKAILDKAAGRNRLSPDGKYYIIEGDTNELNELNNKVDDINVQIEEAENAGNTARAQNLKLQRKDIYDQIKVLAAKVSGVNTERHERVSTVIGSTYANSDDGTVATATGDLIHNLAKDFFTRGRTFPPEHYGMTQSAYDATVAHLQKVKGMFKSGETVIGTNIIVHHTFSNGKKIAGEIDLLTGDILGNMRVWDFKSSTNSFTPKVMEAAVTGNGITRSKDKQFDLQTAMYAHLVYLMSGTKPSSRIIVPFTLSSDNTASSVNIATVYGSEPIVYTGDPEDVLKGYIPEEKRPEDTLPVAGTSTVDPSKLMVDDDDDNIGDAEEEGGDSGLMGDVGTMEDDPGSFEDRLAMAQRLRMIYDDPGKLRDHSHSLSFQNEASEYVSDIISKILYERSVIGKDKTELDYAAIKAMTIKEMQRQADKRKAIAEAGYQVRADGTHQPLTEFQREARLKYAKEIEDLIPLMDYVDMVANMTPEELAKTRGFVGYMRLAMMHLSNYKIINIRSINPGESILEDDQEVTYMSQFQQNYAFKIDPKATVTTDTKVMLSQMNRLNRILLPNGTFKFEEAFNRFGAPKKFPLRETIQDLHLEFEDVNPDRIRDFIAADTGNPGADYERNAYVRSMVLTMKRLAKGDRVKEDMFISRLSSLIKQHRKVLYMSVDLPGDVESGGSTDVLALIGDANRQGVDEAILHNWQNYFKEKVNDFFKIDKHERTSEDDILEYEVTPKQLVLNYGKATAGATSFKFKLPADFKEGNYTFTRMYRALYEQLKEAVAGGNKVHLNFEFNTDSEWVVDNLITPLDAKDVLQITALFNTENFIYDPSMKGDIYALQFTKDEKGNEKAAKYPVFSDTHLNQLVTNIRFLLTKNGDVHGNAAEKKRFNGYDSIIYQMMSSQFERLGIQFAEKKELSYLTLVDLNTPVGGNSSFMKFQRHDSQANTFGSFLIDKLENLIISPLRSVNAMGVTMEFKKENPDSEGDAKITVDEPFRQSRRGLLPFAKHSRTEWPSYANERVRNINGDLMYTYNPHNTWSILMNKILEPGSTFLKDMAKTPYGRFNRFIMELSNRESATFNNFELAYIDGGKVNGYKIFSPEKLTEGLDSLLGWNAYFNGEAKSSGRNLGYTLLTHGESAVMPALPFEKRSVGIHMTPYEDANGVTQFRLTLPEEKGNELNEHNDIYDDIYGVFRGEFERIKMGFDIYNDIIRHKGFEAQKEYAYSKYTLDKHYKVEIRNGERVITPGTDTNMYYMGNHIFTNWKDTKLYNGDKTGLAIGLVDSEGYVDEAKVKERFKAILPGFINELVDDAYQLSLQQGSDMFEIYKSDTVKSKDHTRWQEIDIRFKYLNTKSVYAYRSKLYTENVRIATEEGLKTTGILENLIERTYHTDFYKEPENKRTIVTRVDPSAMDKFLADKDYFNKITEAEMKNYWERFVKITDDARDADRKKAQAPFALLKYMVADRALNEWVIRASLSQLTFDPSSVKPDRDINGNPDYISFHYDYMKRNASMLTPGNAEMHDPTTQPARVVAFNDNILGSKYKLYTHKELNAMDESERAFLGVFAKTYPELMRNGKFPERVLEYAAFYYAIPKKDREDYWPVIAKKLIKLITTDSGAYMTGREWLFRMMGRGEIDRNEYFEAANHFEDRSKPISWNLMKKLKLAATKYVYAGPNIKDVIKDYRADIGMKYIKMAEFPLIPGITVHENSPLADFARMLGVVEAREYATNDPKEPRPGIMAVPRSAMKLGYNSDANIYDEDGNVTAEIIAAPVMPLDRGFLRKQIEASSAEIERATIAIQGLQLRAADIPGAYHFGKTGSLTFSNTKEKEGDNPMPEYMKAEADDLQEDAEPGRRGLTVGQIENATYMIYRDKALRKMHEISKKMGFSFNEKGLDNSIKDIDKFIKTIVQHSIDQYGVASNSTAYLATNPETNRMLSPIGFSPMNMQFQSIILAEMQKIFHRFSLPGGAYAAVSATGLKSDGDLKSHRMVTKYTRSFADEKAMRREMEDVEIEEVIKNKDGTVKARYFEVEAGEAMMVWNFRDENGKLLNYDEYVNAEDGTIKTMVNKKGETVPMIDPELLYIIVNRIPNTGKNTMSRLKVVRFFPVHVRDAIAMAPELVDVYNADFDYDKLFTYIFNHEHDTEGRLVKKQGVLHYTQDNITNFRGAESSKRSFAQNELRRTNREYALLKQEVNEGEANIREWQKIVEDTSKPAIKMNNLTVNQVKDLEPKKIRLKQMENDHMATLEFHKRYNVGTIYSKQSEEQLDNALLDSYHILLQDYKTLHSSTQFLSSDWVHNQLERKVTTVDGEKKLSEIFEAGRYLNLASYATNSRMRVASAEAGKMVGVGANGLITMVTAQKYGLSLNARKERYSDSRENIALYNEFSDLTGFALEDALKKAKLTQEDIMSPEMNPHWRATILMTDNKGKMKHEGFRQDQEEEEKKELEQMETEDEDIEKADPASTDSSFHRDNLPYRHNGRAINAYTARHMKPSIGQIYSYSTNGRFRYDRIYTYNNKGEKVFISEAVYSILQAFLDFKNNPVRGYQNINTKTANALLQMLLLGYVDEAPLVLMQESVTKYIDRINRSTKVDEDDSINPVKQQLATIAEIMGVPFNDISREYYKLNSKNGTRNINYFLTELIRKDIGKDHVLTLNDLTINENMLAEMIPMRTDLNVNSLKAHKSDTYKRDQLKVLRTYLLADNAGWDLFTVQQSTNAISKGTGNSLVDLDLYKDSFEGLFGTDPKTGKWTSSAPSVAGLHRMTWKWAKNVRKARWGKSRDTSRHIYGHAAFTFNSGIKPIHDMLSSIDGSHILYEYSVLYKSMQREYGWVADLDIKKMRNRTEKGRLIKKLNVNFVSYLLSNPDLYRDFFPDTREGEEEFEFFAEYGRRMMTLPDTNLDFRDTWSLFNKLESLPLELRTVSQLSFYDERTKRNVKYSTEYEILNALIPILTMTPDRVSSVIMPANTRFQEGLADRMPMALAAMAESEDPVLESLLKKLILYAYMSGGVVSPNSFVQHIPPHLLVKYNVDEKLFEQMRTLTTYDTSSYRPKLSASAHNVVKSFMVQFIQHHRFEKVREIETAHLMVHPQNAKLKNSGLSVIGYSPEAGAMVIHPKEEAKIPEGVYLLKYDERIFMRYNNKGDFKELDNAGINKYHRNEYLYNYTRRPAETLVAMNKSERSKGYTMGVPELDGKINRDDDDDRDIAEMQLYAAALEVPFDKVVKNAIAMASLLQTEAQNKKASLPAGGTLTEAELLALEGKIPLLTIYNNARAEAISSLAGSVHKILETIVDEVEPTISFVNKPTESWRMQIDNKKNHITINYGHRMYDILGTFNSNLFIKDLAHELAHLGTAQAILAYMKNPAKMRDKNPQLAAAVERLISLQGLSIKAIENNKALGVKDDWIKWKKLIAADNAGKTTSAEDARFLFDNNYLRGFMDSDKNLAGYKNKDTGQLLEFAAYLFSNEDMHSLMNEISFKDTKGNKTFWEKLKEILADILIYFGFGDAARVEKQLATIKKQFTPSYKDVELDAAGRPSQYSFPTGDLPQSIEELKTYSALHAGLNEILEIRKETFGIFQEKADRFSILSAGKSKMAEVGAYSTSEGLDTLYQGVAGYDRQWPDELKLLYHKSAGDGSIIC